MKVTINNKETETQAKNVKELAQELDLPATGCAVAISNEMVPSARLSKMDSIMILIFHLRFQRNT